MNDFSGSQLPLLAANGGQNHNISTRNLSFRQAPSACATYPGLVETEGVHAQGFIGSDFQKKLEAQTPLGGIGQPEDIARIAVFLASKDSGWLTGETIVASGGLR